jgi:hypothetical protein
MLTSVRSVQTFRAALVLVAAACLTGFQAQVPRLDASSAKLHVGRVAIVCGHVVNYSCSLREGTSVLLDTSSKEAPF